MDRLAQPEREINIAIPVTMDNGEEKSFMDTVCNIIHFVDHTKVV